MSKFRLISSAWTAADYKRKQIMCLHFIVAEIMYPMLLANKALSWLVLQQCMTDLLIIGFKMLYSDFVFKQSYAKLLWCSKYIIKRTLKEATF